MTKTVDLQAEATLVQQTSPDVILTAETLALSAAALEETIEDELAGNPALQRIDQDAETSAWAARPTNAAPQGAAYEYLADEPGDEERLIAAVRLLLPADEHELAEAVVGSLDSRLFLRTPPEELAAELGVAPARVAAVVDALRQAGPPGTAARDLRECLLAQLDEIDSSTRIFAIARGIVHEHLEALAADRLGQIAHALRVDVADVADAWDLIRTRLRPCAVIEIDADRPPPAPPPPPELAFGASVRGVHEVEVLEATRFILRIDPLYERACRDPEKAGLERDLRRARRFMCRLEERWATLRALGEALALHQDGFLRYGRRHLRPLTRAQLARELGVHESTVSRAVSGKHAALPDGRVVLLAEFFGSSNDALDALRDLVAQEPRPLCDAVLAEAMRRRGFPVARRTVAKYRSMLAIPPVNLRQRAAGR
jgi:RNA polymerase sigma-54 factor